MLVFFLDKAGYGSRKLVGCWFELRHLKFMWLLIGKWKKDVYPPSMSMRTTDHLDLKALIVLLVKFNIQYSQLLVMKNQLLYRKNTNLCKGLGFRNGHNVVIIQIVHLLDNPPFCSCPLSNWVIISIFPYFSNKFSISSN